MKFPVKQKLLIAALVPALGLPLAASSLAQTADAQRGQGAQQGQQTGQAARTQQQRKQQQQQVRDMRASEIIGARVRDPNGEQLGEVQDLIVDANNEKVNYAILAFGGFLGFGEKLFAYPMDRFQPSGDGQELVLNVSEQELKNAPGFDRSNWPTWGTGGYRGEVDKHFGQTARTGGDLVRMSELLTQEISDRAGSQVGQIEDVVVSVTDGQVRYVVLQPDQDLEMGDRLVMLPMDAIQVTTKQAQQAQQQTLASGESVPQTEASGASQQQQRATGQPQPQDQQQARQQQQQQAQQDQERDLQLVLNVEPKQLHNARSFDQNAWPDLNSPAFQREMDSYVASFPEGGQAGTATGASGDQPRGEAGTSGGAAERGTQSQEGTPQRPGQSTY